MSAIRKSNGVVGMQDKGISHPSEGNDSLSDTSDTEGNSSSSRIVNVEGCVDRLTDLEASGWAWLPSLPNYVVEVEAVVDGKPIARAKANLPRPDLVASGTCTGWHGFRLLFQEPIKPHATPVVRAISPTSLSLSSLTELPVKTSKPLAQDRCDSLRMLINDHMQFTTSGHDFEEFDPGILSKARSSHDPLAPLLLAFYLPQFYPIPENDGVWGRGFTEWRQLPKGISRFPGHYQPRIPRDLGFYNLTSHRAIRAQVDLAKAAGIGGFGFYYYRFGDRRILESPLDLFLASDLGMPFLLIWANESWTRVWNGAAEDIVLKQSYEEEYEEVLLEDLSRHFKDSRYIRLGGRPLFVIYKPKDIPDAPLKIDRWRRALSSKCGVVPLIFMAQTYGDRDPRPYGLDGAMEFPPHKFMDHVRGRETPDAYSDWFCGRVFKYDDFVQVSLQEGEQDFPLIKTIVPSWDNDPRRPNCGTTLEALSPRKYEAWLKSLIMRAIDHPIFDTPIVGINAWNEWGEGAYLEPDVYYGASFLNATARAYVSTLAEKRRGL